jgi:hypothetical protein
MNAATRIGPSTAISELGKNGDKRRENEQNKKVHKE